ncbi:hypothetical protein PC128_g4896 [Phytophthora cactorum]|nr:hypothetical protein PC128_g4896 [Phytophthora cactorum]
MMSRTNEILVQEEAPGAQSTAVNSRQRLQATCKET